MYVKYLCYYYLFLRKKIKSLDASVCHFNQLISTMKHERDMLTNQRMNYKVIEAENLELKAKLNLLQTIESIMTASQKEIDDIMRQNLSSKDLTMMLGALRRELNNTESRKNELRRQLQTVRNDLRSEQEERRKLEDELSKLESENHLILNKFKRAKVDQNVAPNEDVYGTPEVVKKSRQAFLKMDSQNTPSPLNADEFNKRIQHIQDSNSPYFKVKKTSIGLAPILKNPKQQKSSLTRQSSSSKDVTKLSIFKKPRIAHDPFPVKLSSDIFYNGIGGTSKILQSDLTTNSHEK